MTQGTPMTTLISIALAASIAATSGLARAHGDADHAGKETTVVKEQKPWGIAGDAKAVKRTITVSMTDTMRFSPEKIDVKQGDTLKFVLRNDGKLMHEFVIGTRKDLDEHAALMINAPSQRVLFDPAGTWTHPAAPERHDVFYGFDDQQLYRYTYYHARRTHHVEGQAQHVHPHGAGADHRRRPKQSGQDQHPAARDVGEAAPDIGRHERGAGGREQQQPEMLKA